MSELFTLFVFVCVCWYQTHIVLCFLSFFCLRLECPILPVSLDCSFSIAPSVSLTFVYLKKFLVFSVVTVTRSLVSFVILCKSVFVFLFFVFQLMCCLSFFDIRLLITPLVSSNFFIWNQPLPLPPLSEMMGSWKSFPHVSIMSALTYNWVSSVVVKKHELLIHFVYLIFATQKLSFV